MPDIRFYILPSESDDEWLRFVCKLAEKVYRNGQFCYIRTQDKAQSQQLDDLLWSFRPGSFVPHQIYTGSPVATHSQILIGSQAAPELWQKTIINLSATDSESIPDCEHLLEILNNDETRKAAGRRRYKHYRQAGFEVTTHKM